MNADNAVTELFSKPILSNVEAITGHTASVFRYQVFAMLLRIAGGGEEHTLVSSGFFVLAYTAGLSIVNGRAKRG